MFSQNEKKTAGYSPIPDVDEELGLSQLEIKEESQVVSETSSYDHQTLAEKYPDANEHERAFLGALDNAISKCSKPRISLPIFHAKDLGIPDSPQVFLDSLSYPTLALLASLIMGGTAVVANSPIYIALFPYISCTLAFLACIPPIRKRFLAQTNIILTRTKSQKQSIESKVMLLCSDAITQVDTAENFMDAALKPIKSKLDKMTELEQALQIIDPTIDIPDVSDIEEAFDGCTDQIRSVIGEVLKVVDFSVSRAVPETFRSEEALDRRIFYPFVGILLFIQLVGIWISTTHQQRENHILTDSFDSTSSVAIDAQIGDTDEPTQLELMIISIQTYLTSMIELVLAYVASNISVITRNINKFIKSIEEDFNNTLEKYSSETFSLVFDKGLGDVRTKTLKLIKDMEKIEGPLKKAEERMIDYKAKMEALKQQKALAEAAEKAKKEAQQKMEALKEKALAEAKEKAREAEKKAKEAAEKAKEEAQQKMEALKKKALAEAKEKAREAEEKAREEEEKAKKACEEWQSNEKWPFFVVYTISL